MKNLWLCRAVDGTHAIPSSGWWESSGNRGASVVHCPHPALISGPLLVTAECWRVVAIAHIISTSPSKASCGISTHARLRMRLCESYGVVLALVHVVPHSQNGSVSSHPMREVARIAGRLLQTHHVYCPSRLPPSNQRRRWFSNSTTVAQRCIAPISHTEPHAPVSRLQLPQMFLLCPACGPGRRCMSWRYVCAQNDFCSIAVIARLVHMGRNLATSRCVAQSLE